MLATSQATQPAMAADSCDAQRMPFSLSAMCMFTAASTILTQTDVHTSVSLLVAMLLVCFLLLMSLVALLSLLLTGLTGLIRLESPVGQMTRLATNTAQGD